MLPTAKAQPYVGASATEERRHGPPGASPPVHAFSQAFDSTWSPCPVARPSQKMHVAVGTID